MNAIHPNIKSYVLRGGRLTNRQEHALIHLLQSYALPRSSMPWDLAHCFNRHADTIVEIGFGMGDSLLKQASDNPEINFIGIEVHKAGIGSLVANLQEYGLTNVRIATFDAVDIFKQYIPDDSLKGIQIFFPDPWPKKKHHKRRLVQSSFIKQMICKLKVEGYIHCATDWQDYAEHMLTLLNDEAMLVNAAETDFIPRPSSRPLTKFEQRGQRLGHGVWDLLFYVSNF